MANKKDVRKMKANCISVDSISYCETRIVFSGINSRGTQSVVSIHINDWNLPQLVWGIGKIGRRRVSAANDLHKSIQSSITED